MIGRLTPGDFTAYLVVWLIVLAALVGGIVYVASGGAVAEDGDHELDEFTNETVELTNATAYVYVDLETNETIGDNATAIVEIDNASGELVIDDELDLEADETISAEYEMDEYDDLDRDSNVTVTVFADDGDLDDAEIGTVDESGGGVIGDASSRDLGIGAIGVLIGIVGVGLLARGAN
ncbi:DUF4925 domain-containing protein [Halovivax gelatinilyticus]|uniref:DUF4925 domain-containing protein n=1 Tax=Halovivax gelatinilyticus TaxID=2961597 RepID=UPI0020CA7997|nr:DUF4925 domain-containing protein [Halovivax gelatinilyticus]